MPREIAPGSSRAAPPSNSASAVASSAPDTPSWMLFQAQGRNCSHNTSCSVPTPSSSGRNIISTGRIKPSSTGIMPRLQVSSACQPCSCGTRVIMALRFWPRVLAKRMRWRARRSSQTNSDTEISSASDSCVAAMRSSITTQALITPAVKVWMPK